MTAGLAYVVDGNGERGEVARLVGTDGVEARVETAIERAWVVKGGLHDRVILLFELEDHVVTRVRILQ